MRLLDHPLFGIQRECLAVSQALEVGLTKSTVDEAIRVRAVQHPHRGVIALPEADLADPQTRAWAALLTQCEGPSVPAGVQVARDTAIRIWFGNELPAGPLDRLAVPVGYGGSSRPRVRLHQDATPVDACTSLDGLPIVGPAWTVLGIARTRGLRAGVIAADTAYRRGLCTPEELRKFLPFLRKRRGVVTCREVVELARPGTDSPRETELRLVLVHGGLPDPDVDIRITDEWAGVLLGRSELGYRHLLISVEYDGFEPHTERDQFGRDRRRWRWYRDRGWHQLLFTNDDLRNPGQVVREVARAIADAPRRIAGLDPRRSPEVRAARLGLGLDAS